MNTTKTNLKENMEILLELEASSNALVEEAKKFLQEISKEEIEKAERLRKIGFSQAQQSFPDGMPQYTQEEHRKMYAAKRIEYYRTTYPDYKFITEENVKAICKKHFLVMGDVRLYKGFVPEKNLIAIEIFLKKIKPVDKKVLRRELGPNPEIITEYGDIVEIGGAHNFYHTPEPLQICAPLDEMDTRNMGRLEEGYKLARHDDPIVLQPVHSGYLIITAWGKEANDPLVANPVLN